jgi:hypothetical protein
MISSLSSCAIIKCCCKNERLQQRLVQARFKPFSFEIQASFRWIGSLPSTGSSRDQQVKSSNILTTSKRHGLNSSPPSNLQKNSHSESVLSGPRKDVKSNTPSYSRLDDVKRKGNNVKSSPVKLEGTKSNSSPASSDSSSSQFVLPSKIESLEELEANMNNLMSTILQRVTTISSIDYSKRGSKLSQETRRLLKRFFTIYSEYQVRQFGTYSSKLYSNIILAYIFVECDEFAIQMYKSLLVGNKSLASDRILKEIPQYTYEYLLCSAHYLQDVELYLSLCNYMKVHLGYSLDRSILTNLFDLCLSIDDIGRAISIAQVLNTLPNGALSVRIYQQLLHKLTSKNSSSSFSKMQLERGSFILAQWLFNEYVNNPSFSQFILDQLNNGRGVYRTETPKDVSTFLYPYAFRLLKQALIAGDVTSAYVISRTIHASGSLLGISYASSCLTLAASQGHALLAELSFGDLCRCEESYLHKLKSSSGSSISIVPAYLNKSMFQKLVNEDEVSRTSNSSAVSSIVTRDHIETLIIAYAKAGDIIGALRTIQLFYIDGLKQFEGERSQMHVSTVDEVVGAINIMFSRISEHAKAQYTASPIFVDEANAVTQHQRMELSEDESPEELVELENPEEDESSSFHDGFRDDISRARSEKGSNIPEIGAHIESIDGKRVNSVLNNDQGSSESEESRTTYFSSIRPSLISGFGAHTFDSSFMSKESSLIDTSGFWFGVGSTMNCPGRRIVIPVDHLRGTADSPGFLLRLVVDAAREASLIGTSWKSMYSQLTVEAAKAKLSPFHPACLKTSSEKSDYHLASFLQPYDEVEKPSSSASISTSFLPNINLPNEPPPTASTDYWSFSEILQKQAMESGDPCGGISALDVESMLKSGPRPNSIISAHFDLRQVFQYAVEVETMISNHLDELYSASNVTSGESSFRRLISLPLMNVYFHSLASSRMALTTDVAVKWMIQDYGLRIDASTLSAMLQACCNPPVLQLSRANVALQDFLKGNGSSFNLNNQRDEELIGINKDLLDAEHNNFNSFKKMDKEAYSSLVILLVRSGKLVQALDCSNRAIDEGVGLTYSAYSTIIKAVAKDEGEKMPGAENGAMSALSHTTNAGLLNALPASLRSLFKAARENGYILPFSLRSEITELLHLPKLSCYKHMQLYTT